MAKTLTDEGLRIVSGGTDNHLMLVDLRPVGLTGKEAEKRLDDVGITVNKNAIPYDPEKPFVASGIRVGTPAITTCGMKEEETAEVSDVDRPGAEGRLGRGTRTRSGSRSVT